MTERLTRRNFLLLSAITAADLITARKTLALSPEEIHYHSFQQIKSSDFPEKNIRQCISSGPLSLASTLIKLNAIDNNQESIKGVVARALITNRWSASGTDLISLRDLAHSYGIDYKTVSIPDPYQMLQFSKESPAPLLLDYQPDQSQYPHIALLAGMDLYNNTLTLFNPNLPQPFVDLYISQYFQSFQTKRPQALLPSDNHCPVLDADGLAKYLSPQVLRWRYDILNNTSPGLSPNAVASIIQIESQGNPDLVSSAGAMGLMQVMPFHFQSGENPFNPQTNIKTGSKVFVDCLNRALSEDLRGKDSLIKAAEYYSGGSRQYGLDFYALLSQSHREIDSFFCRRTGN